MGSPVAALAQQGNALPDPPGDPPADSVEAEWQTLHDKGFSVATIRTILTATRDTCTIADGRASLAGVVRRVRIPLAHL